MATAGGGTSRSAIAMSLWWLHQFPDESAQAHPDALIRRSGTLAFRRPNSARNRTARQDFRMGGKDIRKGQILHIMIALRTHAAAARP